MRFINKHILILLLFWLPASGFCQLLDITNYSTSEFLGRTDFYGFTQDENLKMFLSTNKGIITYNGVDFNEFKISQDIDNNPVHQIIYNNKALYFSTPQKVFKYNVESDSLTLISDRPAREFKTHNNTLYYISGKSIYKVNNEDDLIEAIYTDDTYDLNCFFINDRITIAGTKNGLRIVDQGKLIDIKGTFINAKAINAENDSSLIVLSEDALFSYLINDNISQSKISREILFKNEKANSLFQSKIGNTYISTLSGKLYQYDGVYNDINSSTISEKNGLNNFPINYLNNDEELNLWVLGEKGLSKIAINQPFTAIPEKNMERIFNNENSVLAVKKNQILTYNYSLKPKIFNIKESIKDCSAIYFNQEWLVTVNDDAIYRIKRASVERESNYLNLKLVQSINDSIFLAIDKNNIFKLYNDKFQIVDELENIGSNAHFIKGNGSHYFISENKAFKIDETAKLSLTDIKIEADLALKDYKWSEFGLWHFSDNSLKLYHKDGGISDFLGLIENKTQKSNIYNIFEDSQSNLWVSVNTHLAKVNLLEENNSITSNDITLYGTNDHVEDSYFIKALELENQQIWFIKHNNISIYNPLLDNPQLVAPGIFIKSAYAINYDEFNDPKDTVDLSKNISTISNKHEIIINPEILSHYRKHKSKLQYRNIKEFSNWITLTDNENIRLMDLSDGVNQIEIRSVNPNGIASKEVINFSINVNPPIWKKDWFYLSAIISFLLLGFVGYKSLNNFKDNKTRELNDKLDGKLEDLEKRSHLQILKSERLKQLNELITSQKGELEKKNKQIESQKYELSLTNDQIKKQKDLLEETGNKLKASINYAQRIQNALMSTEVEVKKAIDDSFIYFLPRDVVSGDFYWFNKVVNENGEELLILAAVDCTGHGVPGAIVSVMGINLLNNITNLKKIYDPGKILNELNTDIINNLRQNETQVNDGMDMSLVSINSTTKTIEFAGAKNPLMYIEDGELLRIRGDKHAIGGQQRGEERAFQTHKIICDDNKKRTFFLFSDGYQDQFGGENGFKFLTKNFKTLLQEIHDLPVLEQKTILHERLEEWMGEYSQTDDVLVIGFKF